MSAIIDATPATWTWGYSLNDMQIIAKMDERTRAVVERYARHCGHVPEKPDDEEASYKEGFNDGVREAAQAAESVYYSKPFKRDKRKS